MKALPVHGRRALSISDTLVVADLHIGVEYELEKKGIRVPAQWKAMAEEIIEMGKEVGAKTLVMNGDVKHGIPSEKWEFRDVRLFLKEIRPHFREIHIVKGNHDGGIEGHLYPWVHMHDSSGMIVDDFGILHGHAWPSEEVSKVRTLVIAHTHPSILFTDSLGNSHKEPCWIKGRYGDKELIVMPAMSRFYGGSPVNEGKLLGPILNSDEFDVDGAEIYLLDGTYVGKLGKIKKRGDGPQRWDRW